MTNHSTGSSRVFLRHRNPEPAKARPASASKNSGSLPKPFLFPCFLFFIFSSPTLLLFHISVVKLPHDVSHPGMACFHLTQTVADAFNALADEVQVLSDRKTILEHKLRFAHEQVSLERA